MLFWTLGVMGVAAFLGVPILPILIVGALLQASLAYAITKNPVCIRLGLGLICVSTSGFILPMLAVGVNSTGMDLTTILAIAPWLSGVSAVITLMISTIIGVIE